PVGPGERGAGSFALGGARAGQRDAGKELDNAGSAPRDLLDRRTAAVADHRGHRAALGSEMAKQVDEKGQLVGADAPRIEWQDETPVRRLHEEIAVLNAVGNALARLVGPDVVAGNESGQVVGADLGIDRHQFSTPRGSLKIIFSCAVTTTSSTIL